MQVGHPQKYAEGWDSVNKRIFILNRSRPHGQYGDNQKSFSMMMQSLSISQKFYCTMTHTHGKNIMKSLGFVMFCVHSIKYHIICLCDAVMLCHCKATLKLPFSVYHIVCARYGFIIAFLKSQDKPAIVMQF